METEVSSSAGFGPFKVIHQTGAVVTRRGARVVKPGDMLGWDRGGWPVVMAAPEAVRARYARRAAKGYLGG